MSEGYSMVRDTRLENFDNWPGKPNRIIEAHTTDRDKVVVKGSNRMAFYIGNQFFILTADETISLSGKLDTGTVQVGKDYYLYAVIVMVYVIGGSASTLPTLLVSQLTTAVKLGDCTLSVQMREHYQEMLFQVS